MLKYDNVVKNLRKTVENLVKLVEQRAEDNTNLRADLNSINRRIDDNTSEIERATHTKQKLEDIIG